MNSQATPTRFVRPTMVPAAPTSEPATSQPQDPQLPALKALVDLARVSTPVQFLARFSGQYLVFRGADPDAETALRPDRTHQAGTGVAALRRGPISAVQGLRKRPDSNPYMSRVTIGRARNNDIVLVEASVSKVHAWFAVEDGRPGFHLYDASSRNGTWVQGSRVGPLPVQVRAGMVLRFGLVTAELVDGLGLRAALQESA